MGAVNFEFTAKIFLWGPAVTSNIIFDSRAMLAVPGRDSDGISPQLDTLTRASNIIGSEVGFVNVHPSDSESVLDSDYNIGPTVINLSDSDGNIVKVVRDFGLI